jgi:hypothetical protein
LAALGCVEDSSRETGHTPSGDGFSSARTAPSLTDFAPRLLEIARTYEAYGRLDQRLRWAPTDCAAPPLCLPRFLLSRSEDTATHGRKLYSLFVKVMPDYARVTGTYTLVDKPNPVGQVVVKEAWVPEEVTDVASARPVSRTVRGNGQGRQDEYLPYARQGKQLYHAKEKAALFIMLKLGLDTPDTDRGWVYGTVSADGRRVTSAGRVASCMKCHEKAPHDRLFGLPGT